LAKSTNHGNKNTLKEKEETKESVQFYFSLLPAHCINPNNSAPHLPFEVSAVIRSVLWAADRRLCTKRYSKQANSSLTNPFMSNDYFHFHDKVAGSMATKPTLIRGGATSGKLDSNEPQWLSVAGPTSPFPIFVHIYTNIKAFRCRQINNLIF
jgi:hypothetical protein